jgi:hypothetical protein
MEATTEVTVIRKIMARYTSSSPQPLLAEKVMMQSFKQTLKTPVDQDIKILNDLLLTAPKAAFPLKASPALSSSFKSHRLLELESELKSRQKAFKQLKKNFFSLQSAVSRQSLEKNQEIEGSESKTLFNSITSDLLEIKFKLLLINQRLDMLNSKVMK